MKNALLFNVLSFFSDKLLTEEHRGGAGRALHLAEQPDRHRVHPQQPETSAEERVSLILASQNLEDFDVDGIRELTRPLFAIPTHQFLFNAGSVDKRFYMDNLQLEPAEFELIRYPQRGVCLYRCGQRAVSAGGPRAAL